MIKPLINQNISFLWHTQLIQGYVKNFQSQLDEKININYYLISRRSIYRSGTRCNHRGIDTDGNTANFVEHESIYVFNRGEKITSHIQIRGSLPILWEQQGLKGKISLAGGEHLSLQSFKKHFSEITQQYGKIFSVSLMAEGRSGEKLLTGTFKQHYEQAKEFHNIVSYDTFDIKHHCKGGKYENINPYIIKSLSNIQKEYSYLLLNTPQLQTGVIRTNCKSSLDRTNIFQSKVELNQLQMMLKDLYGYDFYSIYKQDALDMMENQKQCIQFVKQFKILWSQNGDNISQHYAGTNALTSHATKTGSAGLFGKLRGKLSSIKRLYEGTFQDSHKQEAIDLILGRHMYSQKCNYLKEINKALKFEEDLKEEAFRRESQFLNKKQVSVYIVTWNLKKFLPKNTQHNLKNILDFQSFKSPDILVLCIQKKPDYKLENLDQNCQDKTERQFWIQLLQHNIYSLDLPEYVEVDFHSSGGLMTIILAQKSIIEDITAVEHDDIISTSVGKGTVVIKMNVCDTKLCFINAHLQPGQSKVQDRYQQINEIHGKSFQKEGMSKYKREKIEKADKIFLIGNLNFRINMEYSECIRHINKLQELSQTGQQEKIKPILQYYLGFDQLLINKKGLISNYQESPITFLPTYKYVIGSNKYDQQKERVPSWCDRILMWNNEQNPVMKSQQQNLENEIEPAFLPFNQLINVEDKLKTYLEGLPLFYNRKEIDISDHKPVSAYYIVTVKEEDAQKKDKIFKELVNQKICQVSVQNEQINQLKDFWQYDEEENGNKIKNEDKTGKILNAQQDQYFEESEDDDDDDDEDEDIQGEYDKQQEQQFCIDQTKLNHTTKPKYKYSDDFTDIQPNQLAALNFSNNLEEGTKLKNNKMRFKNAVDSALKKEKLRKKQSEQSDLFLTKYPSEKESIFLSKQKYQSDFQRNKQLNDSQIKSEFKVQYNHDQSYNKLLNSSIQIPSFRRSNDTYDQNPGQLTLQKYPSNVHQNRYSDQIKLTSNDRLVKEQGTESQIKKKYEFPLIQNPQENERNKNNQTQIHQISYLTSSDPLQNNSKKEVVVERESSFFFAGQKSNTLKVPQEQQPQKKNNSEADINQTKQQNYRKMSEGNQQQNNQNSQELPNQEGTDVQVIKFDNLVIINDYQKKN